MIIGHLIRKESAGISLLSGYFKTIRLEMPITLEKNPHKQSVNAPDYVIYTEGLSGNKAEVGAGWLKKAKDSNGGEQFISITIDDMSLEKPIHITAFQNKNVEGEWNIVWSRPRQKTA